MRVSEILNLLPNSLEWMVLFNLSTVGRVADQDTIRAMYHLPPEVLLEPYSHVVLTDQGRFLAVREGCKLVNAETSEIWDSDRTPNSLYDRYAPRLAFVVPDEADCLGLAETPPFAPVLLHLRLEGYHGKAQAIFDREPSFQHYELLQSVGVKFLGGEPRDDYYLAYFQNRLPIHIHAGILSHFSRTAHCNVFFFRHGNIDASLEAGLLSAAEVRVEWSKQRCLNTLIQLANRACEEALSMTCQPPAPEAPFAYGDLVPLGFVLRALNQAIASQRNLQAAPELPETQRKLQAYLMQQQENQLWAFHQQRLITATDSSLVLLGLNEPVSVEALEQFSNGQEAYYPQLWSEVQQPGKMLLDEQCQHWCQPDYATTCVVRHLRQAAGLPEKTSIEYLAAGFETRSGLYFANPYLVDWVLAEAIRTDEQAQELRERLCMEVLSSMNSDYSFGQFDVAVSTALAILTLGALGVTDRMIRVLQLRLMELLMDAAKQPPSIPFYSTLYLPEALPNEERVALQINEFFSRSKNHQKQIRMISEQLHHISLYWDTHQMVSTALFALALAQSCDPVCQSSPQSTEDCHPRYRCKDHCEYIAKFALPPYLNR